MKKCVLILTVFILTSKSYAGITDSLSIGFGGGYSSYNTFRGEVYLKSDLKLGKLKSEIKIGMNNHSYQLTFDNVSDLNASSIGIFGDMAVYPFGKGLFAGLRWEALTFNWLSEASKNKIISERSYTPTSLYTGTNIFLQIGYKFKISNSFGIKLYGQPGLQTYKITNGSFSSGSYVTDPSGDPIIEDHSKFIYNVNLSIEIKIK
jgi:hypothetical protein